MMKLTELQNIFSITYGNKFDLYKMTPAQKSDDHSVAFIARTKQNNGIVAYVEKIAGVKPYPKGAITVALGGSVLSTFIQHDDFYTAQNVAVLQPLFPMAEQIKLFYCIAIRENVFRYSTCGREANKTLKSLLVPRPDVIPKWITKAPIFDYGHIKAKSSRNHYALEIKGWKAFRYNELFDIKKGQRVTKLDLIPGCTPFLSAIDKNNGIREFAGLTPLNDGNVITVNYNGSVGEAFYQERPFWASDDVNILCPKFKLNKYIAMFITTLIRHERYRFNYGRKWHKERMEECNILLPTTPSGRPDFKYMENFIKSLPYSASI